MFSLPLSLRERLSLISPEDPLETQLLVHGDTLYLLILSPTYLELIYIFLDGRPEVYHKKAIFPFSACLCVSNNKVTVYSLSRRGLHIFSQGLEEHTLVERPLEGGSIKSLGGRVVFLTNNTFFREEGEEIVKMKISPYFSTVVSFSLMRESSKDTRDGDNNTRDNTRDTNSLFPLEDTNSSFPLEDTTLSLDSCLIFYKTKTYFSIYKLSGGDVLSKFETSRGVFVGGDCLFLEEKGGLVLFKVTGGALEQKKRFSLNLKGVQHVWLSQGWLMASGEREGSFFFYHREIVYNLNFLVESSVEHRGGVFCGSRGMLYFLPRDPSSNLKLSGTEFVALNNILENKFSPFVTRTFDYNEEALSRAVERRKGQDIKDRDNEDIKDRQDKRKGYTHWEKPLVKTFVRGRPLFLPETPAPVNGLFLSLLVSQAFQVQICKLICNGLKFIKRTGRGREYLKMLHVFSKLRHRAYRAFSSLEINFSRLWESFTCVLALEDVNLGLLLHCLSFDFQETNLQWEGGHREWYEVLRGVHVYKESLFGNANKRTLVGKDASPRVVSYLHTLLEKNRDIENIFYLYQQTGCLPSPNCLSIIKEDTLYQQTGCLCPPVLKENKDFLLFLEKLLRGEEDCEWFVSFLGGEYDLVDYSKKYSKFVLRECLSTPLFVLKGLDFFYRGGDSKGVAKALYVALKGGHKPHPKYLEMVGDYVFVGDNKFIGREKLTEMM